MSVPILRRIQRHSLLMNSIYLMLATGATAAFGFVFWTIVTHSYDTATVGLATTLLSLSGLLSLASIIGFDSTFVRFLPSSERKNDQINSGLLIVAVMSVVLSTSAAFLLPWIAPSLTFVTDNPWYFLSFIFFTTMTSLNTLTNAIFLAFKRGAYILGINIAFSIFKIALPLLVVDGDAMTIFNVAGAAQLLGLILSIGAMKRRLGYSFSPKIHVDILRTIKKYSLAVFASSLINLLPPTLLPLLIMHEVGAEGAAYFYIAFTIANLLYVIAYSSMQSVFAEGSHNEAQLSAHVKKAIKLIAALLIPAAMVTVIVSEIILHVFGQEYATEARALLELFAASSLPVTLYAAMGTVFKVTKNLRGVIVVNIVYAGTILGLSYVFLPQMGLIAVGWAWLIGNLVAGIVGLLFLVQGKLSRAPPP